VVAGAVQPGRRLERRERLMPRFDSLTPIHKAVRALVYAGGGALQTTDFSDRQAAAAATADLAPVLHLMHDHHATEEKQFFPELMPFEPALVGEMLLQHEEVVRLLGVTQEARGMVETSGEDGRVEAGAELNRRFNELVAFYLEHLAQEEAKVLPAMWRHLDDERLIALQAKIVAESDPETLFQWLGWMFRGLNHTELVGLLTGAKTGMPAEALEAVKALGASTMEPARWEAVRREAGI
jgi:hypothetical protein